MQTWIQLLWFHLLFMSRLLQLGLLDYEVVLTLTLTSTLTLLHCILLC